MRSLPARTSLDPGWLFVLAGLAVCVASVLVPAQSDLAALRRQHDRLLHQRRIGEARLAARRRFLDQLERGEPQLVRRLAAAQLNLAPADGVPLLVAASRDRTVTDWIDESITAPAPPPDRAPDETLLSRLTGGRHRVWLLAGGIMSMFIGLLIHPHPPRSAEARPLVLPHWPAATHEEE